MHLILNQDIESNEEDTVPLCVPGESTRSFQTAGAREDHCCGPQCACRNAHWASVNEEALADIELEFDLYNATVVAAMGGLEVNLNEELFPMDGEGQVDKSKHKGLRLPVHPVWVLLLCFPLFSAQLLLLCFMEMDSKFQERVYVPSRDRPSVLVTKAMLVAILQVMMFQEMQGSLKALAFVLNPTTWTDIIRKDPKTQNTCYQSAVWSWPCLFLPSVTAIAFKLGIAYLVTVESVSVILQCDKAQEAIFNALTLTFITDMDVVFWGLVTRIFRLEGSSPFQQPDNDNFRFYSIAPSDKLVKLGKTRQYLCKWWHDGPYQLLTRRQGLGGRKEKLPIGGRHIERWLIFSVLFFMYLHQLNFVMFAFKTNVLPLTRDTCSFLGWSTGALRVDEVSKPMRLIHTCRGYLFNLANMNISQELLGLKSETTGQLLIDYCAHNLTAATMNGTDIPWKRSPKMPGDWATVKTLWVDEEFGLWYKACFACLLAVILIPQFFGAFAFIWYRLLGIQQQDDAKSDSEAPDGAEKNNDNEALVKQLVALLDNTTKAKLSELLSKRQ